MYKTKKRKMFRTNYSQQFPFLVNIGGGTRATGSSRLNSRVILMPTMLSGRLFQILTARYINFFLKNTILISALPGHDLAYTQACAGCSYWAVGSRKHGFQIRRAQTDMHPIQDCHSCNLPPLIKRRNEYLRFPFKVKIDYFILNAILVSSFVIFFLFFAMNKRRRTYEASGC